MKKVAYRAIYSFVDRDMFMRYCGGAMGHKTTQDETRCLLDDRDELDKIPFELECEQEWEGGDDVEMGSGDSDDSEDMMEDQHKGGESDIKDDGSDGEGDEVDGDNSKVEGATGDLGLSTSLADGGLLDEMEEFRYTGLDQVVEEEEALDYLGEDELGAEDGKNMDQDESEPQAYL